MATALRQDPFSPEDLARWRELCDFLKVEVHVKLPLRIHRRAIRCGSGMTYEANGRLVVAVSKWSPWNEALYVLMDELAHAMTHSYQPISGNDDRDHNWLWGIAYAAARRLIFDFIEDKD